MEQARHVLILGCGFTGRRVAARLIARGIRVIGTTRHPERLAELARTGLEVRRLEVLEPHTILHALDDVPADLRVVHSIPVVQGPEGWFDPTPRLLEALAGRFQRIVYLSTTGVYGDAQHVDETTPPNPKQIKEKLRLDAEHAVANAGRSWLVLRCPAIYGPGRGVHRAMIEGRFRLLGDGSNWVSRIHVDDLAAHVVAGLFSDVIGAYPVGDDEPCRSREIALFCAELLGLSLPQSAAAEELHETRQSNRRVDGRAIRRLLGIELRFPTYRIGIPATLAAERAGEDLMNLSDR